MRAFNLQAVHINVCSIFILLALIFSCYARNDYLVIDLSRICLSHFRNVSCSPTKLHSRILFDIPV